MHHIQAKLDVAPEPNVQPMEQFSILPFWNPNLFHYLSLFTIDNILITSVIYHYNI